MVETVLVPMDDSPLAGRALQYAMDVHPDATLVVLHVVDYVEESYAAEMLLGAEELHDRALAAAERLFDGVRERTADHRGDVRTVTRFGRPARVVTEYVDEADVDLVVIGSHGRSLVSRALVGDTAATVVRDASVPVTVVR